MHENTCRAESHKYQSLERFVATLRQFPIKNSHGIGKKKKKKETKTRKNIAPEIL